MIGGVRTGSMSAVPPMITAVETGKVEATTRETTVKAADMETPVETMMKLMMMREPKPEPYGNTVGVVRQ